MEEKIIVVKLTTGAELICVDGGLGTQNKRVLQYAIETVTYADGSVGFSPFIPAAKTETLEVRPDLIAFDNLEPQDEMKETYKGILESLKAAASGVLMPEQKGIIT